MIIVTAAPPSVKTETGRNDGRMDSAPRVRRGRSYLLTVGHAPH